MKVLVIAAHPDDETLGVGGSVARHVHDGDEVHLRVLGEGGTSRYSEREGAPASLTKNLENDLQNAARVLGAASAEVLGLADNRFDQYDLLDIVKLVETEVAAIAPELVYTHSSADLNIDHRVTAAAVLTGTRPIPGSPVDAVLAFAVPSSTEWAFSQSGQLFLPNHFVELTKAHLATKIAALRCYAGEMRSFPHPRSHEVVDAMSRLAGATVGVELAEAFQVLRSRARVK